jgi:uncharacterized membrane protein
MPLRGLGRYLGSNFWVVPVLCMLGAIGLALGTTAIDRHFGHGLIPQAIIGNPNAAQTILSSIASSMVTLLSLALTLTLVVVQLAMGQFSPRIVRALLSDHRTQLAIGLFAGTFVYAILVLRRIDPQGGVVPGLSVLVAYVLMIASIAGLILYAHHTGQKLRVAGLIDLVGDELREQLDDAYPAESNGGASSRQEDARVIVGREPGVVTSVDHEGLVAAARSAGCVLEMVPMKGDFVPVGAPLFRTHGEPEGLGVEEIVRLVALERERKHEFDTAFGFRKLVDIAERSIAQPFDDPTTAVQAIHRLHDCLRQLATRPFPSGEYRDAEGQVRLVVHTLSWEGYVRLAFDELRLVGASSPQVTRRLRAALEDLKTVAPPERQPVLDRQLGLLEGSVREQFEDEKDVEASLTADQQGIGSGRDIAVFDSWTDAPLSNDGQRQRNQRADPTT